MKVLLTGAAGLDAHDVRSPLDRSISALSRSSRFDLRCAASLADRHKLPDRVSTDLPSFFP